MSCNWRMIDVSELQVGFCLGDEQSLFYLISCILYA